MPASGDLDARLRTVLNRHPAVGLAVAVVRAGSPQRFFLHGLADVASRAPITENTVFRVGSLTKTFTAIALMQLVERGLVDLDAPVDDQLRAYRLVPADATWPAVTARQLLTHTSGIGEVRQPADLLQPVFGEMVKPGRRVPPLPEYYRRGLPVVAEPGSRWRYTGHGFATLGQLVEDVSGQPIGEYLRERVFEPLGMADTRLFPSDEVRSRTATGYALRSSGAEPVPNPEQVTAAAGAGCSTLRDLGRYVAALLGGGANEYGSVLEPATLAQMFAPQYQPDPRIPGMGLAFFRGEAGGHPVVEHGGLVPGFDTQLLVAPDDGLGVVALTNGTRGGMFWLPTETEGLLRQLLGVPPDAVRTDVAHSPEVWAELCGRYVLRGPVTDVRARAMAGAGVQVIVRGSRLRLRVLTPIPAAWRGFELHPDSDADAYVFRIDLSRFGMATARVVFSNGGPAGATAVHFDRGQFLSAGRPARAARHQQPAERHGTKEE